MRNPSGRAGTRSTRRVYEGFGVTSFAGEFKHPADTVAGQRRSAQGHEYPGQASPFQPAGNKGSPSEDEEEAFEFRGRSRQEFFCLLLHSVEKAASTFNPRHEPVSGDLAPACLSSRERHFGIIKWNARMDAFLDTILNTPATALGYEPVEGFGFLPFANISGRVQSFRVSDRRVANMRIQLRREPVTIRH